MRRLIILFFIILSVSFSDTTDDFKKWEIKYNYSTLESKDGTTVETPYMSFYYKKQGKYILIYNREAVYRDVVFFRNGEYLELYKGNFYYILGQNDFMRLNFGVDYTHKLMTYGIKINKYDDLDIMFYKLQRDHYYKNGGIASFRITGIDGDEFTIDYMAKYNYKIWHYSYYFDFDELNKILVEVKINKNESRYDINAGYGYNLTTSERELLFGFGVKF